mgnify:CR=1 FL=1
MIPEERAAVRRMLGSCPCGLAPGAEHCPICDGPLGRLGQYLRDDGKTLAEIRAVEEVVVRAAMDYTAAGIGTSPEHLADVAADLAADLAADSAADLAADHAADLAADHAAGSVSALS